MQSTRIGDPGVLTNRHDSSRNSHLAAKPLMLFLDNINGGELNVAVHTYDWLPRAITLSLLALTASCSSASPPSVPASATNLPSFMNVASERTSTDQIYVSNFGSTFSDSASILVFKPIPKGSVNEAPSAEIIGSNTLLQDPTGI